MTDGTNNLTPAACNPAPVMPDAVSRFRSVRTGRCIIITVIATVLLGAACLLLNTLYPDWMALIKAERFYSKYYQGKKDDITRYTMEYNEYYRKIEKLKKSGDKDAYDDYMSGREIGDIFLDIFTLGLTEMLSKDPEQYDSVEDYCYARAHESLEEDKNILSRGIIGQKSRGEITKDLQKYYIPQVRKSNYWVIPILTALLTAVSFIILMMICSAINRSRKKEYTPTEVFGDTVWINRNTPVPIYGITEIHAEKKGKLTIRTADSCYECKQLKNNTQIAEFINQRRAAAAQTIN